MTLWTDRYLADTRHLTSPAEHGAYLLLLMESWRRGGSLPDDDVLLAKLACCAPAEWVAVKPTIMGFWTLDKRRKVWTQRGQVKELNFVRENRDKKRNAARTRWNKAEKGNADAYAPSNAHAMPPHPHPHLHKEVGAKAPTTRERASPFSALAPVLGEDLARAFIDHRKALRAPMTLRAAELMARKLGAMPDPRAAAERSITKGYRDVFPDDAPSKVVPLDLDWSKYGLPNR